MIWFRIERFIGRSATRLGYRFNNEKLIIWGITHTPFLMDIDEEDWEEFCD